MRKFYLSSLLVLFAITGCVTTTPSLESMKEVPVEIASTGQAVINVARDVGFSGSGLIVSVYIDSVWAANLSQGERITLHVEPGSRLIRVDAHGSLLPNDKKPVSVAVLASEAHPITLRIGFGDGGSGPHLWQE